MKSCGEYFPKDKKAKKFFANASDLLKSSSLPVLRIGDYNTTGVTGADDDREGNWYNLVKCAGSSAKGEGEGGSFGIGKNAPFAASALRTVLYSTRNAAGEQIFEGVARLVTHSRKPGVKLQATGFLGNGAGDSVRDADEIPKQFRRDEKGTDILLLGYKADNSWASDLIYSVLEYFWPAIHRKNLEVEVGGRVISAATLPKLMTEFAAAPDFAAHHYYEACVSPNAVEFTKKLQHLGQVQLWLLPGEQGLPKRVAMVRKTGMVIYHRQFRPLLPFAGYFLCATEPGNNMLRSMEPPAHDAWDKDRPEKNSGTKALSELIDWMRECIQKLRPADDAKVIAVPDLHKFLPDDDDAEQPGLDEEQTETHVQETPERPPKVSSLEVRPIVTRPASTVAPHTPTPEPPEPDDPVEPDEPKPLGEPKPPDGPNPPDKPKPPIPATRRAFRDEASGAYRLVVVPAQTKSGMLAIFAVGDDARHEPVELESAVLAGDGAPLAITGQHANRISGLAFKQGEALRLEVKLKRPERLSLEVFAHET
jgi:hypothetical protein